MDFARSELAQRQPVLNTTGVLGATDPNLDTPVYGEYDTNDDDLADGMTTPPRRPSSSIGSPSTSDDLDVLICTPPPMPAFTHPPSPPRPAYNQALEDRARRRRLQPSRLPLSSESAANPQHVHLYDTRTGVTALPLGSDNQPLDYKRWFRAQLPASSVTDGPLPDDMNPRKPLTSIAGSNRCLWPPGSTFLTMSSHTSRDPSVQNRDRGFNYQSPNGGAASSSTALNGGATSSSTTTPQKNHNRSDSFKDSGECLLELQPRRKTRRMMDGPYFKERNDRMVASHVQKLIQEAVEDGVGELDLSNLELTDLPSEVRDLNFAIVYNERGSFSLSRNRLKLFLSSNQFTTIPMHVFDLHNLSVLSLRNNNIKAIPPEIGLLYNLVELSIGGNLLEYLPSQIALLPKLHILTIHPNPLMVPPEPEGETTDLEPAEQQQQQHPDGDNMDDAGVQQEQQDVSMQNNDDIEMTPAQEQDSQAGPSVNVDSTVDFSIAGQGENHRAPVHPQSTAPTRPAQLPPHRVLRSRFPTLAHLAGNVILNHIDAQMKKAGDESVDRPRKDSKISMDGEDFMQDSVGRNGEIRMQDITQLNSDKQGAASKERRVLFRDEVLKEYMTPYLFDIFKRAQINNRCSGCQRRFWKPCRILVVWQDLLGQRQVPIRWKACGLDSCIGVPESLWPRQASDRSPLPSQESAARPSRSDASTASPSSSSGSAMSAVAN
ncbi:hypothetical protein BGX29_007055 [Mortierella sp. GBA35]|nr:hypothetical protein BGX29_007055 [Mortierella sp. GBA35]